MTRNAVYAALAFAGLATIAAFAATGDLLPGLAAKLQLWQQDLHRDLAAAIRAVRDEGALAAGGLVLVSFLYGVIHAAGPGHGKAVVSAYVLADARHVRRGLGLAWAAALLQAVTAIALVGIVALALGAAAREAQPVALLLERIGYGLVAGVGIAMVATALRRALRRAGHDHHHDHHHDHAHCGHAHLPAPDRIGDASWRRAAALVLSVGLRPCSGALLVLGLAHVMGMFLVGVVATVAMAVGTALTNSGIALLALGSRHLLLRFASGDGRWVGRLELGFALLGGTALLLLGAFLFAGSFQAATGPLLPR